MSFVGWAFLLTNPLWTAFLHGILCRIKVTGRLPRQMVTVIAILSLVLIQTLVSFLFLNVGENRTLPLYSFLVSLLSGHVYFHIFNMSETARRIRILIQIRKSGSVAPDAFERENYSPEEMVKIRLQRLVELQQISESRGVYKTRPSILLVAAMILKAYETILFPIRGKSENPNHPRASAHASS